MALKRLTTVWKSIVLLIFSCANLGRPALYSFRGPAKERSRSLETPCASLDFSSAVA